MTSVQAARFTQIAIDAIIRAEKEQCAFEDYVEGLEIMLAEVQGRLEEAQDELGVRDASA